MRYLDVPGAFASWVRPSVVVVRHAAPANPFLEQSRVIANPQSVVGPVHARDKTGDRRLRVPEFDGLHGDRP